MRVTMTERRVINAVIAFANIEQINSPDDVYAAFRELHQEFHWTKGHAWLRGASVQDLRKERRQVCQWLGAIAAHNPAETLVAWRKIGSPRGRFPALWRVAEEVNAALPAIRFRINAQLPGIELIWSPGGSVQEFCAIGIAYLFEKRLLRRVRRCPLNVCCRYRVTFEGKPWNYCSVAHQREGERLKAIKRVKKWREQREQSRRRPT